MAAIYVKEQGSYIKKKEERISIEKNGKELMDFPIHTVSNVSIFGNVQVTTQALHMMALHGIDITFFTYSGMYVGHLAADTSKNIFLRLSQYKLYDDEGKRMEYAKKIVENKIKNQIATIVTHNWKNSDYDYSAEIVQLQKNMEKLNNVGNNNEIMGIEGICSAIYFTSYAHMFSCKITFDKRTRRPPKDPINVILSLAYTLLTKEVAALLEAESFETYLGFLHGIRYGRKSLALDIVEEFRQPVVDRLVVILFNKRMISELDFEQEDDRIVLTEDGFKKFCKAFERWMKSPVGSYEKRSFRVIIQEQVGILKKAIKEKKVYQPYEWRGENVSDLL